MRSNVSKKKRRKKKYRLATSKEWIRDYTGDNIVISYSKWYGVDLICSIKELRLNGIEVSEEYEKGVKESIETKKAARKLNKENRKKNQKHQEKLSDERFAFIVGYTSGGAAYGITHEEMEIQLEEENEEDIDSHEIFKN